MFLWLLFTQQMAYVQTLTTGSCRGAAKSRTEGGWRSGWLPSIWSRLRAATVTLLILRAQDGQLSTSTGPHVNRWNDTCLSGMLANSGSARFKTSGLLSYPFKVFWTSIKWNKLKLWQIHCFWSISDPKNRCSASNTSGRATDYFQCSSVQMNSVGQ